MRFELTFCNLRGIISSRLPHSILDLESKVSSSSPSFSLTLSLSAQAEGLVGLAYGAAFLTGSEI